MKKNKKKKNVIEDDGRTIVNMNVDGFSWYVPGKDDEKAPPSDKHDVPTRKERLALIRGAYLAMLPYFLILLGGFLLAFLAAYLWLR